MLDYRLYYWDLPFRGSFIQLFLEEIGAKYKKHDASELYPDRNLEIDNCGMAPPYLYDCKSQKYLAQMPAILMYLGHKHDYLPKRAETLALTFKMLSDCNDVLMEITNYNGTIMWNKDRWEEFRLTRLSDWMKIFEKTGLDHGFKIGHGFKGDKGYLLGSKISVVDIATTALFGTMIYSFPELQDDLQKNAPHIATLCQRIEARPSIKRFLEEQRSEYGQGYCGGQIEQSLRKVIQSSS